MSAGAREGFQGCDMACVRARLQGWNGARCDVHRISDETDNAEASQDTLHFTQRASHHEIALQHGLHGGVRCSLVNNRVQVHDGDGVGMKAEEKAWRGVRNAPSGVPCRMLHALHLHCAM